MANLTPSPKFQAFDTNGDPLSGGKLFTYLSGTSTPATTYTDAGGGTPNANPVILDSRGEADVWLPVDVAYRFTLKTAADVLIWTVDGIYGQLTTSGLQNNTTNWVVAGGTADAITATYSPAITTLADGQLCFFRASAANATTTPSFSPNGLTARTITLEGGAALRAGEIPGALAEVILRYNLANTRWELLNPAFARIGANADITSASAMAPWSNGLINGGFELWQRGAGGSASIAVAASSAAYTADRWRLETLANQACTVSQQAGLIDGSQYSGRVQRNSGQTGVGQLVFEQPFELAEIVKYRGKTITVSFRASTGANWSPASGTLNVSIFCGTGAARARANTGYTGETTPMNNATNIAAGSASAAYSITSAAVIPTNTTQMSLVLSWTPTGTAGANDWFQLDDVMWSVGTGAQPFERMKFSAELELCRPWYEKSFNYATAPAQNVGVNTGEAKGITGKAGAVSSAARIIVSYKTPKRVAAATITLFNPAAANGEVRNQITSADLTATTAGNNNENVFLVTATGDAGGAVGDLVSIHWTASAEL